VTQSEEYPDLKWMSPAAYGTGRDGKAVRYIVIHYTAGAERSTSAEDGAAYDQHRTDGTSTHYFVDSNSIIQCVPTKNRGNAARNKGNRLGIQYELCGTAQTRAQWLDAASLPTLQNAARQVARDCKKYDIPVRRLSVAETREAWDRFPSGPKGIVGHVDCTNAYPEDGGDHTDPGKDFPWDVFLDMVRAEMEDDMTKKDFIEWLADPEVRAALCRAVNYTDGVLPAPAGSLSADGKPNEFWTAWGFMLNNYNASVSARTYAAQARDKDAVDEKALSTLLAQALPPGAQVTEAQLQSAVVGALRELAASSETPPAV